MDVSLFGRSRLQETSERRALTDPKHGFSIAREHECRRFEWETAWNSFNSVSKPNTRIKPTRREGRQGDYSLTLLASFAPLRFRVLIRFIGGTGFITNCS